MPQMHARSFAALALAALTGACASTGAVPRPFPIPGGAPGAIAPGTAAPGTVAPGTVALGTVAPGTVAPGSSVRSDPFDGYALTSTALSLRGVPYRNGGSDPNGFDCSGFTQYVFGQHGVFLPRGVSDQYKTGKPVRPDEVAAGDLLFFTTVAPGPTHVAIAIGGDEFIHAPSSAGVVRVERLRASYWAQRFIAARRVN